MKAIYFIVPSSERKDPGSFTYSLIMNYHPTTWLTQLLQRQRLGFTVFILSQLIHFESFHLWSTSQLIIWVMRLKLIPGRENGGCSQLSTDRIPDHLKLILPWQELLRMNSNHTCMRKLRLKNKAPVIILAKLSSQTCRMKLELSNQLNIHAFIWHQYTCISRKTGLHVFSLCFSKHSQRWGKATKVNTNNIP